MRRALLGVALGILVAACGGKAALGPDGGQPGGGPDATVTVGLPADPTGLIVTATSATSVTLSWQVAADALGYVIDRRSETDDYATVATPTSTSFTDEGLTAATRYSYRVRTLGAAGLSPGVERTVTTDGGPGPIGGGSSFELIEAALASGALDRETAVKYKAFAEFKDPRLPGAYRGDDTGVFESDALDEIYDDWATLSPAARKILEPFLIPPAYLGSFTTPDAPAAKPDFSLRTCYHPVFDPDWGYKAAAIGSRVKVWYDKRVPGQDALASTAVTALETEIWPRLIDRLGMRAPLSDAANEGCNGGDGRLDIYLVDMASHGLGARDYGVNKPVDYAWKERPTFIYINHNLPDKQLKGTLAHELMHASQWAYPLAGLRLDWYSWLKEATAQWAIDHVYPTQVEIDNFEQEKAPMYLAKPDQSIDTEAAGRDHIYGSYLFFQFLARTGKPAIIKDIWENARSDSDERKVVDTAIAGGFHKQWPEFAKLLWNQLPVAVNSFKSWDKLEKTPALYEDYDPFFLASAPGALSMPLDADLDHLAVRYYRFHLVDPKIRSLAISVPDERISVQAFVRMKDSILEWKDFSGPNLVKHYCLDLVAERVEELVVVLANASPTDDVKLIDLARPRLVLSSVGCWRYQGTASVTTHEVTASTDTLDETVTATVTFEVDSNPLLANDYARFFYVHDGSATGRSSAVGGGCSTTSDGSGSMKAGQEDGRLDVSLGFDFGAGSPFGRRVTLLRGESSLPTTWTRICSDTTDTFSGTTFWTWLASPAVDGSVVVEADGTIAGDITEPLTEGASGTRKIVWSFTPVRQ